MVRHPLVFGCLTFFLVLLIFPTLFALRLTKVEAGNHLEGSVHHESNANKVRSPRNHNFNNDRGQETEKNNNFIVFGRKNYSKGTFDPEETFTVSGIVRNCVNQRRGLIIRNFSRGKTIIVNCFKAAIVLKLLKYLAMSSNASIKIFNGILEFDEISNPIDCDDLNEVSGCTAKSKSEKTMKFYKNLLFNGNRNHFNERMVRMFVDEGSKNFRVDKNMEVDGKLDVKKIFEQTLNDIWDKSKEDEIRRELADPKLLTILNALSRLYLMKINFYPGVWLEVKRNFNDGGGIIFDLVTDVEYSRKSKKNGFNEYDNEEKAEDVKIKKEKEDDIDDDNDDNDDDDDDDDDDDEKEKAENENYAKMYLKDNSNKLELLGGTEARILNLKNQIKSIRHGEARSGTKKKKKKFKKKKILKHLLIPFAIQMAILPFFLKNLFFLAAKALLAGKAALVLIVFNMLRNSQVEDENYSIRVEHYGYKKGEEYGAWINGRNFGPENPWFMVNSFNNNQEPYRKQIPNH